MFSVMEFARIGIVPVHVLRGLEVAGLLVPRRIGPEGGRRWYDAGQLPRLNRILVLTDLGFTLPQVRAILGTRLSEPELRGVLRLRQAELAAQVNADAARLERVAARLTAVGDEPVGDEANGGPADGGRDWWTTSRHAGPGARPAGAPRMRLVPSGGMSPGHRPVRAPRRSLAALLADRTGA